MCIWPHDSNLCSPRLHSSSSVSILCTSLGHLPIFHDFVTTNPSNTHSQAKVSLFHGKVLHLLENLCVSNILHSWKSAAVCIWFVLIHRSESLWFFVQNSIFSLVPWHSLFDLYTRVMISKLYVVSIQQSLTYYNLSLQICRAGVGLF